jgi:hypothetical protein
MYFCVRRFFFASDPPVSLALGHELGPNGTTRDGGQGSQRTPCLSNSRIIGYLLIKILKNSIFIYFLDLKRSNLVKGLPDTEALDKFNRQTGIFLCDPKPVHVSQIDR